MYLIDQFYTEKKYLDKCINKLPKLFIFWNFDHRKNAQK